VHNFTLADLSGRTGGSACPMGNSKVSRTGRLHCQLRTGRLHCQLRTEPRSNGVLDGSEVNGVLNSYTDTDDCPPNLSV
jgi:hypothetical protein